MRSLDIKVVKFEGDVLFWFICDVGYEVCFVVMYGLMLWSDFLFFEQEVEVVVDVVYLEIIEEMRLMLEFV